MLVIFVQTLMKHYQALAGWTFAFEAYYSCNLTQEFHNDVTQEIWDVEDMFSEFILCSR